LCILDQDARGDTYVELITGFDRSEIPVKDDEAASNGGNAIICVGFWDDADVEAVPGEISMPCFDGTVVAVCE